MRSVVLLCESECSERQMTKRLKHASGLLRGNAFTRENRVGPRPGRESLQTPPDAIKEQGRSGWAQVSWRFHRVAREPPVKATGALAPPETQVF